MSFGFSSSLGGSDSLGSGPKLTLSNTFIKNRTPLGGDPKVYSTKALKNPKYNNIVAPMKGKTGINASNYKAPLDTRGEIFLRIKRTQLFHLLAEKAEGGDDSLSSLIKQNHSYSGGGSGFSTPSSPRSVSATSYMSIAPGTEFVLVDVRSPDDFETVRIWGAVNFTSVEMSRDQYPKEMYAFKSRPGRLVILYTDSLNGNEKRAEKMATELENKGWENVCVLTGGLVTFV